MAYSSNATTRLITIVSSSWVIAIAVFRDFTYDESWSYLSSTAHSITDIILYRGYVHANNHVYNSALFHTIGHIDAPKIAYRSLSVVCFYIFLKQVHKISQITGASRLLLVSLCCFAPYISYFSLARGYALALTCFILGYRILIEHKKTTQASIVFGLTLFICSTAIFSFSYGAIALWVLWVIQNRKTKNIISAIIFPTILLFAAIIYVYHAGEIIILNDPYIPKSNNLFKNGLVSSLISYQAGGVFSINSHSFLLLRIIQLGSVLVLLILQIQSAIRKVANRHVVTTIFLLSLIIFGFFASHTLLGTPYPLGRAVVFILPVIYLLCVDALRNFKPAIRITFLLVMTAPVAFGNIKGMTDIFNPSIERLLSENNPVEVAFIGLKPTPWISAPIARTIPEVKIRKYAGVTKFLQSTNPPNVVISPVDSLHLFPVNDELSIEMQAGFIWINMTMPGHKLID